MPICEAKKHIFCVASYNCIPFTNPLLRVTEWQRFKCHLFLTKWMNFLPSCLLVLELQFQVKSVILPSPPEFQPLIEPQPKDTHPHLFMGARLYTQCFMFHYSFTTDFLQRLEKTSLSSSLLTHYVNVHANLCLFSPTNNTADFL